MATSYICEHSVEFFLVPYVKSLLERDFECVAPVFPWLSREFGRKSKSLHRNDSFYVLSVFPRRPKISENSVIYATINAGLQTFRVFGKERGISVVAGCPLATNFWELAVCDKFSWIDIGHPETDKYLVEVSPENGDIDDHLLSDEQLIDSAKLSDVHTLSSFEDFVRSVRYSQSSSIFGERYKPVYFLMKP